MGVVKLNGAGETVIAVTFDSNQIKSADPITYDDNGNVIPLSERFNSDNNDIRYSLSAEDEIAPTAGWSITGKDIAPVRSDIPTARKLEPICPQ